MRIQLHLLTVVTLAVLAWSIWPRATYVPSGEVRLAQVVTSSSQATVDFQFTLLRTAMMTGLK